MTLDGRARRSHDGGMRALLLTLLSACADLGELATQSGVGVGWTCEVVEPGAPARAVEACWPRDEGVELTDLVVSECAGACFVQCREAGSVEAGGTGISRICHLD